MRYLVIVLLLALALTVPTCATGWPATADLATMTPSTPVATPLAVEMSVPVVVASPQAMGNESQLKMVLIRASAAEVARLRKMPLEIVRVRPIAEMQTPTTKSDFLHSEFIVEAVAPAGLLARLRELGFDVTESP